MPLVALGLLLAGLLAGCSSDADVSAPAAGPDSDAGTDQEQSSDADANTTDAVEASDALQETGVYPCGTKPPSPDDRLLPSDVSAGAPDVELRAGSDRIEMYARKSSTMTDAALNEIAARACEALTFDLKELAVAADEPSMQPAVRIIVLDDATYDTVTQAAGSYGITYAGDGAYGDAIVVPESGTKYVVDFDDTLAHELTHIVQGRMAPDTYYVTWFLLEGAATLMGTQYGMYKHNKPTDFVPGYLVDATGADATLTFDRYGLEDKTTNMDELGHDQAISAFFVEYLRVKSPRPDAGTGYLDVQRRLLGAMVQVSNGSDEPTGFAANMDGLVEEDAKTGFTQFLDATVGKSQERFGGTLFE
jgi:hypothetical protein